MQLFQFPEVQHGRRGRNSASVFEEQRIQRQKNKGHVREEKGNHAFVSISYYCPIDMGCWLFTFFSINHRLFESVKIGIVSRKLLVGIHKGLNTRQSFGIANGFSVKLV